MNENNPAENKRLRAARAQMARIGTELEAIDDDQIGRCYIAQNGPFDNQDWLQAELEDLLQEYKNLCTVTDPDGTLTYTDS